MNGMVRWFGEQPAWLKVTLGVAAAAAVVATGGAVAVAVGGSQTLFLAAGPVVLATGEAAKLLARGRA